MPRRDHSRVFRFDRVFRGVGRIQRSSGASSLKEFQRRDQLLTELFKNGQLEALRAFQRGELIIEQLVQAKRGGHMSSDGLLRDTVLDRNLWDELNTLYSGKRDNRTLLRYHVTCRKFATLMLPKLSRHARIRDLLRIPAHPGYHAGVILADRGAHAVVGAALLCRARRDRHATR